MQKFYTVVGLAILIVIAIFTVTNGGGVTVNLLGFSKINTNVAVLILVCFTSGVALMALIDAVRGLKTWKEIKSLKKRLKDSEDIRALLEAQIKQISKPSTTDKPAK